nr:transcription factor sp3 [Quercus suber]
MSNLQHMQTIPPSHAHMQPAQQQQQLSQQHQQPPPPPPEQSRASTSPASEPARITVQAGLSSAKLQSKKNQYPCPMAKQFGCTDYFTTSGHAARHAKKHTGKKDAFCPECNKAFTRKDNMEQHRRTHQNGRGASRSAGTASCDDSKVKKSTKQTSKKTNGKSMMPQSLLDQSMMMPPTCGPYFIGGNGMDTIPVAPLPMAMPDLSGRPQLQRSSYGMNSLDYVAPAAPMTISEDSLHYSYPSPGLSNGLNSLALAASEHQRLSQEKASSHSPSCERMRGSPSSSSDQTP